MSSELDVRSRGYIAIEHKGLEVLVERDFGNTSDDLNARFGDNTVLHYFMMGIRTAMRNRLHVMRKEGKNKIEIERELHKWKPIPRRSAPRSRKQKLANILSKMNEEERVEALKLMDGVIDERMDDEALREIVPRKGV